MTNCPNCGAAKDIRDTVCPYCDTSYFDFTDIDLGSRQSCIVRFRMGNETFQFNAYVGMAEFTRHSSWDSYRDEDGMLHRSISAGDHFNARIEFVSL